MKRALVAAIIWALLVSTLVALQPVNSASGQFDALAEPPAITIVSPENKTYAANNITLSFNVSRGSYYDPAFLDWVNLYRVWFKGDWQQNDTYVDQYNNTYAEPKIIEKPCETLTFSCNLTGIPEGSRNITVYATEQVPIPSLLGLWDYYTVSLSVSFAVDTAPPSVSILFPEAKVYGTPDVLLSFTVDAAVSEIAYSLDGSVNVTVAGNTTLFGLAGGSHTVKVYAWDEAGNVGASEAVTFTVVDLFQVGLVIAIIVTVVVVVTGLLFYFRKRKR